MTTSDYQALAVRFYLFALAVFAVMQVLALATNGTGAQEGFEFFAEPGDYHARLIAAGNALRVTLMLDFLFIIGYSTAIGLTACAYAPRNRPAAWLAGLGILAVVALDLGEDILMLLSLDQAEAGLEPTVGRIVMQAQISGLKWFGAAIALVALTLILPQDTAPEKLLVWLARTMMPIGAGLFVTGAFDLRLPGALIILSSMIGGLALLALTTHLRVRRAG